MGTGKTECIKQLTLNQSVLLVANTISLTEAMARRLDLKSYNSDYTIGAEYRVGRLAITGESLWKVPTWQHKFDYVVMDEVDQEVESLLNSVTCKRRRPAILANLEYFLVHAKKVLIADADLSSTVINWISHLRGEKPHLLLNQYIPHLGRKCYKFSSQEAHFQYGCDLLGAGKRVMFVTDSKKNVKQTGSLLAGKEAIEGIEK